MEDFNRFIRDFLASEYERITFLKWNWRKLFLPWWHERIAEQCEKLRNAGASMLPRGEFLRAITGARIEDLRSRVLRKA